MALENVLLTLVPVIISGIVAIATSKEVTDLKDQLAVTKTRIARLEQALMDNNIPIPPLDRTWRGR